MSEVGAGNITLLIFTCEGREHLLKRTTSSFFALSNYRFAKTILAVDGEFSSQALKYTGADLIVQNTARKGYVENIRNAVNLVTTPYLFWLEDDWTFNTDPDIVSNIKVLNDHPGWAQVVYSKYDEFPPEFKNTPVGTHLYESPGFSANPCICRTVYIREAFQSLGKTRPTPVYEGFETYVSRYFAEKDIKTIIRYPGEQRVITHEGYLESTGREYHSVNLSAVKGNPDYVSGFANDRKITVANKLAMLPKLFWAALVLGYSLFRRREAYDYALRIFTSYQKNFKN